MANDFSSKGLYYFDSDDNTKKKDNIASLQDYYTISLKPLRPIVINELPCEIQELIKENKLPISDFGKEKTIEVLNAY